MFILGENEPQVVPPIPEPLEPVVDDPEEEDDEEEEEPDEAPVGA
jgi:hypothetical protein